jgi:uncharacterized repeat protein (TIGR03847 family)
MSPTEIDLRPVTHITTDAIGQPGKRVFYIQGNSTERSITLIVEKIQIQSLAIGLEQFLAEVAEKFPNLLEAVATYDEQNMHILPPVDPLFRVGELGLSYDADTDQIVLIARELVTQGSDPVETTIVRFWCTRSQLRAMCLWGVELALRGRPICTQCGESIDPEGHFCPKKNGHKH